VPIHPWWLACYKSVKKVIRPAKIWNYYIRDKKLHFLYLQTVFQVKIFFRGHYLFLEAHSFPRAMLSENWFLLGTDNVRRQISKAIFAPNGGYCLFIIHQIFSLARDWSKRIMWPNMPLLKLGDICEYSPIFKTVHVAKNIWRIIHTIASAWLWKYAQIFVFGHYLFLEVHSFSWALLLQKCSLFEADNIWAYFRAKWRLLFIYPVCPQ